MPLVETHVTPSASVGVQKYFAQAPTDLEFVKVTTATFRPKSSSRVTENSYLEFEMPELTGDMAYIIQDSILRVVFEITLADGNPLPDLPAPVPGDYVNMNVACVNNTLHSMFTSLSMALGGTNVS